MRSNWCHHRSWTRNLGVLVPHCHTKRMLCKLSAALFVTATNLRKRLFSRKKCSSRLCPLLPCHFWRSTLESRACPRTSCSTPRKCKKKWTPRWRSTGHENGKRCVDSLWALTHRDKQSFGTDNQEAVGCLAEFEKNNAQHGSRSQHTITGRAWCMPHRLLIHARRIQFRFAQLPVRLRVPDTTGVEKLIRCACRPLKSSQRCVTPFRFGSRAMAPERTLGFQRAMTGPSKFSHQVHTRHHPLGPTGCHNETGSVLTTTNTEKEAKYAELVGGNQCILVVIALEAR